MPQEQPPTLISVEDPRVRYAAERTHLAWIRTGLAMMGFGFVVARFGLFLRELEAVRLGGAERPPPGWSLWIGIALIGLGIAVSLASAASHWRDLRRIRRGEPLTTTWSLTILVSVLLATIGVLTAVYLLVSSR